MTAWRGTFFFFRFYDIYNRTKSRLNCGCLKFQQSTPYIKHQRHRSHNQSARPLSLISTLSPTNTSPHLLYTGSTHHTSPVCISATRAKPFATPPSSRSHRASQSSNAFQSHPPQTKPNPARTPKMPPQTILVTGGAGYVGSHTTLELLNAGHNVVVVDNLCNSFCEKGAAMPEGLRRVQIITGKNIIFYPIDIRDATALKDVFEKVSVGKKWAD